MQAVPDLQVSPCEQDAELGIVVRRYCPDTGSVVMRNRINIIKKNLLQDRILK